MIKKLLWFMVCLVVLGSGRTIYANTIVDPTTGSTYTLSFTSITSTSFDVFLKVDTTTTTLSSSDFLNAVSLKLVPQNTDITSVSLVAPIPATFSNPVKTGGLNANGCDGSGNGFFCDQSSLSTGLPIKGASDVYTFEWLLNVGSASDLLTGTDAASVKALYVNAAGSNVGITSEDITLTPVQGSVPEPTPLILIGTGLVGLAGLIYRKVLAARN